MYAVKIHKQAKKKLQTLSAKDRLRITDKVVELSRDPDSEVLDVKKLVGNSCWRMRVGTWRIIYDRDDILKIIAIERVGSRGGVYK
ncbi:MAG: type II toxin-antitoxin system RelE/ParE family toxin [Gammaproteobacteria bacterium]|nr:type II toxin-antitoxin system RelE/ParE family toxin [Gammaproteobacteria bacterium]